MGLFSWKYGFQPSGSRAGGIRAINDSVCSRLFDNFETYADTAAVQAVWNETNATATLETVAPMRGAKSMKLVTSGAAAGVSCAIDNSTFGYPFPGSDSKHVIRYLELKAKVSTSTAVVRVSLKDASDADNYRYWHVTVGTSDSREIVIDLDSDNTESYPGPIATGANWDPALVDTISFENLGTGLTFYFDDIVFYYEYSLVDMIGFATDAPKADGDEGSINSQLRTLYSVTKGLEGKTEQYVKQGIAETEVGQSISWALELLSSFTPPSTTEITPGNYTINRVRHGTTTEIVASTPASESAGTIYTSYTPEEDNWLEGDLIKVTFSGGYVETDEDPTETLTANADAGQAVVTVDNAFQWQTGWRVRIYDDTPDTEYATILSIDSPTTLTLSGNLSNSYTTAANAGMTRVIQTELTTAVFFTRVSREPTAEEYGRNWEISDQDIGDVADATGDTERWTSEVVIGAAEASTADINTTVAGKLYVLADPDDTPLATGYGLRRNDTSISRFFTAIIDDTVTWGTTGASSGYSLLDITKGGAYDGANYVKVGREKSNTQNRVVASASFGGVTASAFAAITDDALAYKIQRTGDIWRCYYSLTQYPDYLWVLVKEFEDTAGDMTEETSVILESYSPGNSDAQTIASAYDHFAYQVNSGFLEQMYEQASVVPIVTVQDDPRVDQNVAGGGLETVRISLININNGLPVDAEITEGTALVDRYREGIDAGWVNQAGETITNSDADGYISLVYDFPNATWQPGDQCRFTLQSCTITDAVTGRVITLPPITAYVTVGGPQNTDSTQNLWLGDVIGSKDDTADWTHTATTSSAIRFLKGILGAKVIGEGTLTTSSATVPADTSRAEANDYWKGSWIVPLTGAVAFQPRLIVDFANAGGVFTLDAEQPFTAVPGLVTYIILSPNSQLVPAADSTNNQTPAHVVGNKTDTRDFTYDATTSSLVALIKGILGSRVIEEGTFTTSSATVPADTIIGAAYGNNYFDGSLLVPVAGDVAFQPRTIVDFTTTTGVFTMDADHPFSAATGLVAYIIVADDKALVATVDGTTNTRPNHVVGNKADTIPAMNLAPGATDSVIRHLKAILERVGATPADPDDSVLTNLGQRDDAATNDDMSDITTTSIEAKLRLILNRLSSDAFTATIQGGARTELDTMLAQLATYLSASGAAWSVQVNGLAARTNLEQTIEDLLAVIGCDGVNVFDPAMFGGSQTTIESAFAGIGTAIGVEYDGTPDIYDTIITGHDSSAVTANEDGSVEERLEDVKLALEEISQPSDYDNFDVADADANTERWDVGYLNGTEGGSADINTTTAGKLRVSVDPDVTPTAGGYGAHLAQPITNKYFSAMVDLDVSSFGTPAASWATLGIRVSPTTYDINNVVYCQRQSSSDGVGNRLAVGAIFNGAGQGEAYFTSSDNALSFKIERLDNVWRCYYSLTQSPDYAWVLLQQYEDPSEYMDAQQSVYLDAYSPGNADTQTAIGDFDNFRVFEYTKGVQQALAGDYDSSAVTEDGDGSALERLEELRGGTSTGTHNIEVAHGTAEQTIADISPTRHGRIAVEFDVATLVTAGEGGTVTLRLQNMIDGSNLRTISRSDMLIGVDDVFPVVEAFVQEGTNTVRITVQVNSAVLAQRACPYRVIQGA